MTAQNKKMESGISDAEIVDNVAPYMLRKIDGVTRAVFEFGHRKGIEFYRKSVIEYIQETYGDTEVGKQILKSFEPIHLTPLPKMPWEER